MIHQTLRLAAPVAAFTAVAAPALAQQEAPVAATLLQITSTAHGQEVGFKGVYMVDAEAGLQLIEGTTPFEVTGVTSWALAVLEQTSGSGRLQAELVTVHGDREPSTAKAAGPLLSVEYNPRRKELALARERLESRMRGEPADP